MNISINNTIRKEVHNDGQVGIEHELLPQKDFEELMSVITEFAYINKGIWVELFEVEVVKFEQQKGGMLEIKIKITIQDCKKAFTNNIYYHKKDKKLFFSNEANRGRIEEFTYAPLLENPKNIALALVKIIGFNFITRKQKELARTKNEFDEIYKIITSI